MGRSTIDTGKAKRMKKPLVAMAVAVAATAGLAVAPSTAFACNNVKLCDHVERGDGTLTVTSPEQGRWESDGHQVVGLSGQTRGIWGTDGAALPDVQVAIPQPDHW